MNCAKNESKIKELNEKIQKLEEDDEGELEQAQAWLIWVNIMHKSVTKIMLKRR